MKRSVLMLAAVLMLAIVPSIASAGRFGRVFNRVVLRGGCPGGRCSAPEAPVEAASKKGQTILKKVDVPPPAPAAKAEVKTSEPVAPADCGPGGG